MGGASNRVGHLEFKQSNENEMKKFHVSLADVYEAIHGFTVRAWNEIHAREAAIEKAKSLFPGEEFTVCAVEKV